MFTPSIVLLMIINTVAASAPCLSPGRFPHWRQAILYQLRRRRPRMRLKKARHAIVKASRAWPEVDRLRENPSDRDQNPIGGFQFPDILENELGRPLEIESKREMDARRFLEAMRERFESFSLSLHPEKTRLIEFGRFAAANRKRRGLGKPETFQFLGFSFICGKTGQLGGDAYLLVRLVDVDLGPAKPAQSPGRPERRKIKPAKNIVEHAVHLAVQREKWIHVGTAINTAIISPGGGNVGIGFAVPINMARRVMEQLVQYGEVRRGQIGISIRDLGADLAAKESYQGAMNKGETAYSSSIWV